MNMIYGCYPSFFSRLIANKMVEHHLPITHIMLSTRILKIEGQHIEGISGIKFIFKRFGIKYAIFQLLCETIVPAVYSCIYAMKGKRFHTIRSLCNKNSIKLIESNDFSIDIDKIEKPDVFISMCLDQKLSRKFINSILKRCVNVHPSDLPNFGGVEPLIQLGLSKETLMGITVHDISEIIDNGDPIITKFVPTKNKSYFALMIDYVNEGVRMLVDLNKGQWLQANCERPTLKYPYRSWPTKRELDEYSKNNSFFVFRDFVYHKS